jgi:hypothetical protein
MVAGEILPKNETKNQKFWNEMKLWFRVSIARTPKKNKKIKDC